MRYFILPFFFVLVSISASSQKNQKPEQIFLDAEYYRLYEEYSEALPLYQKLINKGYDNAHINYRIGECYLQLAGSKERAIPYLEAARENISEKFKEGSFKEKSSPIYTLFYLGKAYQINNQLDKALTTYNTFLERINDKDDYNMSFVNKQIRSCEVAKQLMKEPIPVKRENIGNRINNSYSNIKPVVNNNETRLIFTSELKFYDAVFMAKKGEERWQSPVNLTPQIKSDGDLYNTSLNDEGNKLLLLKSNPYNGDLYISEYDPENKEWKKPDKLNNNINSRSWETHGCLCNNNRTIYFTSNRKGGMGGLDIYVSHYNYQKKEWGKAKNLGSNVNTPYNEETPFLTADGKKLYFSSQGHQGMGGFDIFYVEKLDDDSWSEPVNVGYPVNTTDDDLFFCPVNNGKAGYIAKYGKDSYGNKDIYRIEFLDKKELAQVELKGEITFTPENDIKKEQIELTIQSLNDNNSNIKPEFLVRDSFSATVKPGKYRIKLNAPGYSPLVKTISIDKNYQRKIYSIQADLQPKVVVIKDFINVDNIYFGYDSHTLNDQSKEKLDKVVSILKKYPDITIDIIGHTDSKGSKEYNKKLSMKRAESVMNYLKSKDISEERLVKGAKGESYPIAINTLQNGKDCAEGRKYNRRVELLPSSEENKYVIKNTTSVPNDLRKRGQVSYSVLLVKKKKKLPSGYFTQFNGLSQYTIKEYYNNDKYLYILGQYNEQNEAIEPYKEALNAGFEQARILSSYQLSDILNLQTTPSQTSSNK